jgi:hypothetical protein
MLSNGIENEELKPMKTIKQKEKNPNKGFNFDSGAFAAVQVLEAFVLFRNTLTTFAGLKLVGLSLAN